MKHKDECRHGTDAYIDTFTHENEEIDLYLFETNHGKDLCLRYGSEPAEHYSPGTLDEIQYRQIPLYEKALTILADHGHHPIPDTKRELKEVSSDLARCLCITYKIHLESDALAKDCLVERLRDIQAEAITKIEKLITDEQKERI